MPPKRAASAGRASAASAGRHWLLTRHDRPLLYIPNLIGYARIAFAAYAFSSAATSPGRTIAAYWAAFACDELDGRAARALGQSSSLGAVLDMVTDRLATACLLALLCARAPANLVPLWLGLLALDISSHWFQAAAASAAGAATHKDTQSSSSVVRLYYSHRMFMGACCISCEVLYLALYALTWGPGAWGPPLPGSGVWSGWPGVGRALVGVASAASGAAPAGGLIRAARGGALPVVPLAAALVLGALPGAAIKQFVNCVQLRTAVGVLAGLDGGRAAGGGGGGGGGGNGAAPAAAAVAANGSGPGRASARRR